MFFRKDRAQKEGRIYADLVIKTPPEGLGALLRTLASHAHVLCIWVFALVPPSRPLPGWRLALHCFYVRYINPIQWVGKKRLIDLSRRTPP